MGAAFLSLFDVFADFISYVLTTHPYDTRRKSYTTHLHHDSRQKFHYPATIMKLSPVNRIHWQNLWQILNAQRRVVLAIVISLMIISTLLQSLSHSRHQQLVLQQHYAQAYAQQIAMNSRDLFAIEDLLSLNIIAKQSSLPELVKGVRFEDKDGQLLSSIGDINHCPALIASAPIGLVDGQTAGQVLICFAPPLQQEPLTDWLLWFAFIALSGAAIYGLFRSDSVLVSTLPAHSDKANDATPCDISPEHSAPSPAATALPAQCWQLTAHITNLSLLNDRLAPSLLTQLRQTYLNLWQQHSRLGAATTTQDTGSEFQAQWASEDHHSFHQALAVAESFSPALDSFNRNQRKKHLPILKVQLRIAQTKISFEHDPHESIPLIICSEGLPLATQATLMAREDATTLSHYGSSPILGLTLNNTVTNN